MPVGPIKQAANGLPTAGTAQLQATAMPAASIFLLPLKVEGNPAPPQRQTPVETQQCGLALEQRGSSPGLQGGMMGGTRPLSWHPAGRCAYGEEPC